MYAIRKTRVAPPPAPRPGTPAGDSYYDARFGAEAVKLVAGEYLATAREVMLVTVLGSCIAACLHDPAVGIGGMNHFMLPDSNHGDGESARYGAYAMEMLINDLLKQGARRASLQAKVFGGGNVVPGLAGSAIGDRNAEFALDYLAREEIPVVASDLMDVYPRRVHFFPRSGRVMVRRLASARDEGDLLAQETLYRSRLAQSPTEGSVELFT
jgi:chemotaxis protein CheD